MSPYRTPPPALFQPKRTPWHRLVWARIRGLRQRLLLRADRHWWAERYPRASWVACQDVAIARIVNPAECWDERDRAERCLVWEHTRGYYQPYRVQPRTRVTRQEHERWIRDGVNPT